MSKPNLDLLKGASPADALDVPYDTIKLPSKGLLYEEDHPLCGEVDVAFRAMNAESENILVSRGLIKKGTVIPTLIKSCLMNKAIDPGTLLLGDRSAILLALRISGFGAEYKANTICPSCGHSWSHIFDLSKVQLKMLEVEPIKPNTNLFEFILPSDKKTTVHFSLLTISDQLEIMLDDQSRKKALAKINPKHPNLDIDTTMTDELLKTIKSVNGKTDREFIVGFVKKMKIMDTRALRRYIHDISPDLELEQEAECGNCGEKDSHKISISMEFLYPSLEQ